MALIVWIDTINVYINIWQTKIYSNIKITDQLISDQFAKRWTNKHGGNGQQIEAERYGRHIPDDIFNSIFLNENIRMSINDSLKFVPKSRMNHIPVLVQIMAWRRLGDKPLSEPMMVNLLTHICVTRPQWVNPRDKCGKDDQSESLRHLSLRKERLFSNHYLVNANERYVYLIFDWLQKRRTTFSTAWQLAHCTEIFICEC